MKLKLTLLLCAIFGLSTTQTFAVPNDNISGSSTGESFKKVGAAGAQFLKIGVGARAEGMAGAYSAVANDITSIFWNPAGLYQVQGTQAMFAYTSWFGGYTHNFAAITLPLGSQFRFAASFISLSSENIGITTMSRPEGTGQTYSVNDAAINLSLAGKLTDQFTFGINAKYINNSFYNMNANGFAFDIGTNYDTGIEGIKLAFSIHNLGSEQRYSGQSLNTVVKLVDALKASPLDASLNAYSFTIPITFRAGIAADLYKDEKSKVLGAFDFATLSDTPENYSVGAEYSWDDFVFVRGGYKFGHDNFGLGFGAGIKYNSGGLDGRLDYSASPTSNFGLVNRLSVVVGFN